METEIVKLKQKLYREKTLVKEFKHSQIKTGEQLVIYANKINGYFNFKILNIEEIKKALEKEEFSEIKKELNKFLDGYIATDDSKIPVIFYKNKQIRFLFL